MGFLFGKRPKPQQQQQPLAIPPPPTPTADNSEAQRKMQEAAEIQRKARGRASTILTGPQGLEEDDKYLI